MGRNLKLGVLALLTCICCAAAAWAQVTSAAPPDSHGGDPLNALWSLLGSGGAAGVLYLWAKSERDERRETTKSLIGLFEADATHKVELRERLKGQDELLARVLAEVQALRRGSPVPSGRAD